MEIYGVKLIGVNAHTGEKLLFTLGFILAFVILRNVLRAMTQLLFSRYQDVRLRFWIRQGIDLASTVLLLVGLLSIWFDNPANLATGVGLASAGLAFALQRVITSLAGYLVILRGKTFNVGDRISMGGVRGDVIALGFIQTTIMEMGQPPSVQGADPAMWISGRQFTGRIVTVTNSTIFDEPVYNYSREFPIIWEEMRIPVTYTCDRVRAEAILLDAAQRHTAEIVETGAAALEDMMRRFTMRDADLEPRVFYRITDNWLELGLRFLSPAHGARALKDAMSRDILLAFDEAGIGIASATTTSSVFRLCDTRKHRNKLQRRARVIERRRWSPEG
jgi:small-conductance mechanosensitive channel